MKTTEIKPHPIRSIRKAAVPICGFETADPDETIRGIRDALNGAGYPVTQWDCVRGLIALNEQGQSVVAGCGNPDPAMKLDVVLTLLSKSEIGEGITFLHNMHRWIEGNMDDARFVSQAIWNLRDSWKATGSTLVLLAPSLNLPPELNQDVVIVSEAAPTQEEIERLIRNVCKDAGIDEPSDNTSLVDATLGYLSGFAIEQSLSMSVRKSDKGKVDFDLDRLWELKVQNLKTVAGLEVLLPKERLSDLVGNEGYKSLVNDYLNGREKPRGVLHLDEVEKMTAGSSGGDMSGVSQAMLEQLLYWFEARHAKGLLLVGIPGAGKTRAVACTAGEARVPHLRASMSTAKGSLVGQSEQQMARMLKSVDAVTQGRTLVISTCNSLDSLPPELMSRLGKLAVFVFDYPTSEESAAIWKYYKSKYALKDATPANTRNWVGREIESCCERAWMFNCSLEKAANSVVPICTSNSAKMDALRQSVSGRFLSASEIKTYTFNPNAVNQQPSGRRINN